MCPRIPLLAVRNTRPSSTRQATSSSLRHHFSSAAPRQTHSQPRRQPLPNPSTSRKSIFSQSSSPSWQSRTPSQPLLSRFYSQHHEYIYSFPPKYVSISGVIWTLIGLNAAVFGVWQYAKYTKDRTLTRWLHLNATLSEPVLATGKYYHTLITSAFSHRDLPHFIFNMVSLHAFGSALVFAPHITALQTATVAIGSALASSFAFLYHQQTSKPAASRAKKNPFSSGYNQVAVQTVGLGASGVVMGLSAVTTCLMPLAPMRFMFIPVSLPLFVLTGAYYGIDMYYLHDSSSRVGHAAHLGGAVFGAVYYLATLRRAPGSVWRLLSRR